MYQEQTKNWKWIVIYMAGIDPSKNGWTGRDPIHLTTQDILPTSEFVWSGLNLMVLQLRLELSCKQNEGQGRRGRDFPYLGVK